MNDKRLEKLIQKKSQLESQITKVKNKEKFKDRKQELRRKILVGSYFLEQYESSKKLDELFKQLDDYLKLKSDRILFNLSPIASPEKSKKTKGKRKA